MFDPSYIEGFGSALSFIWMHCLVRICYRNTLPTRMKGINRRHRRKAGRDYLKLRILLIDVRTVAVATGRWVQCPQCIGFVGGEERAKRCA